MEIRPQFKAARVIAGLTQKEACDRIGVAQSTLSGWENGVCSPPLSVAVRMSAIYNVPLDQLAGIKPLV